MIRRLLRLASRLPTILSDRRPLSQIGGLRSYLRQIASGIRQEWAGPS